MYPGGPFDKLWVVFRNTSSDMFGSPNCKVLYGCDEEDKIDSHLHVDRSMKGVVLKRKSVIENRKYLWTVRKR